VEPVANRDGRRKVTFFPLASFPLASGVRPDLQEGLREDRFMSHRVLAGVLGCAFAVGLSGCGSDEPDSPPGLERIDGPAQVDPSFDPFATTPPTVTDVGG
jgi:hypothetical protein